MSSFYGNKLRISIFGQSHAPGIGVVIEGLPAGFKPDMNAVRAFMARRAPGKSPLATARREADEAEILSGLADGACCGAPLCAVIRNADTRSGDYAAIRDIPRPGHADYTAQIKYGGHQDSAGGGHFSGRLTAPICFAGALAIQWLGAQGVTIASHVTRVGGETDRRFDPVSPEIEKLTDAPLRVLTPEAGARMARAIESTRADGDSVGGEIECAAVGVRAGVGEPMFDGLENRIARAVFGIPAVKGIAFGAGFEASGMSGSAHNDAFYVQDGRVLTRTNNSGGILGGISNGMPVIFRVAIKPTPSIAKPQESVNLRTMAHETLALTGRHDPCIVPRAVPCVEAAAALALCDAYLEA